MTGLEDLLSKEEITNLYAKGITFGKGINPLSGRRLTTGGKWIKSVVKIQNEYTGKIELRLYGWFKQGDHDWRLRQKFNISKTMARDLSVIFKAYGKD